MADEKIDTLCETLAQRLVEETDLPFSAEDAVDVKLTDDELHCYVFAAGEDWTLADRAGFSPQYRVNVVLMKRVGNLQDAEAVRAITGEMRRVKDLFVSDAGALFGEQIEGADLIGVTMPLGKFSPQPAETNSQITSLLELTYEDLA
jgi:hypothetical protein